MEYAWKRGDFSDEDKATATAWVKKTLGDMSLENDDIFVQYIIVMISSGKSMSEISTELEAFMGDQESSDFALRLGSVLSSMEAPIAKTESSAPRVVTLKATKTVKGNAMSQELTSSRGGAESKRNTPKSASSDAPASCGKTHNSDRPQSRLLQSALKTTLQPQGSQSNSSKRKLNEESRQASSDHGADGNKRLRPEQQGFATSKRPGAAKIDTRTVVASEMAAPPNPPNPMQMFDPALMAQQLEAYAQMMGFESTGGMMEYYNMNMMTMMSGVPPPGPSMFDQQWGPKPSAGTGRWNQDFRGGRSRGRFRGGYRGGRYPGAGPPPPQSFDGGAPAVKPSETGAADHFQPDAVAETNITENFMNGNDYHGEASFAPRAYRGRGFRGRSTYDPSRGRGTRPPYAARGIRGRASNMTWVRPSDMGSALNAER